MQQTPQVLCVSSTQLEHRSDIKYTFVSCGSEFFVVTFVLIRQFFSFFVFVWCIAVDLEGRREERRDAPPIRAGSTNGSGMPTTFCLKKVH
jgi:hypothetical protein